MNHEEHNNQVVAVKVLRNMYPILEQLMWAIPNGEERPKVMKIIKGKEVWWCPAGKRAKEEGQLAGVWDLIVAVGYKMFHYETGNNTYCPGLIIEMKSSEAFKKKNQGLTPAQLKFGKAMFDQGWDSVVCCSSKSMIFAVDDHMRKAGYEKNGKAK
jgi:hypothetical protein